MAMRCVVTSPVTTADFRKSRRSEALTLPSNLPWIITALALTLAFTFPFGPTVRLWLRSSMLPSTLPSTYKSSDPDNSPLITSDLPMWANSPVCGAFMLWPPSSTSRCVRRESTDCKSSALLRRGAVAGNRSASETYNSGRKARLRPAAMQPPVCYHRLNSSNVPSPMMAIEKFGSNSSARISIAHSIAYTGAWILLLAAASFAAQTATVSSYQDPTELVRKAVQNEIKAANDDTAHFLFRGTKTTPKGSTTKLYVETKEVTAGLTVANNGKPLTPEQRQTEEARLERFIKNPEELKKKRTQEPENPERNPRIRP